MAKQKNRVISFFNQSQAETCKITQFPPEIISTKLSKLLRYNIIQTLVVFGNVVDIAVVADCLEVATGTFVLTVSSSARKRYRHSIQNLSERLTL